MRALVLVGLLAATPAAAQGVPPIGEAALDAATAFKFFDAACLGTQPSFAGAPGALEANGFARNPETGTWYHPTLNLSVQADDACTMVFASDEDPGQVAMTLAMGVAAAAGGGADVSLDPSSGRAVVPGPDGSVFEMEPVPSQDGRRYYIAGLTPG